MRRPTEPRHWWYLALWGVLLAGYLAALAALFVLDGRGL